MSEKKAAVNFIYQDRRQYYVSNHRILLYFLSVSCSDHLILGSESLHYKFLTGYIDSMGIIRTFLSILVVLGHIIGFDCASWPYAGGGATIAVNMFFVISGFYMALVLDTKYTNILAFYKARALRLYPIYFATIIFSMFIMMYSNDSLLAKWVRPNIERLISGDAQWYAPFAIFSNLTFFGLDLGSLLSLEGKEVALALESNVMLLSGFTIVPQAWSLGIEILFYLLIPFILRAGWVGIIGASLISISTNVMLSVFGFYHEPWNRMFFFSVLIYFMLGVMVCRASSYLKLPDLSKYLQPILAVTFLVIASYAFIGQLFIVPWPNKTLEAILIVSFAANLPILFRASKDSAFDRWIGELSYPIYITHFATLALFIPLLRDIVIGGIARTIIHLTLVIAVSLIGVFLITIPMEKVRSRQRIPKQPEKLGT